MNFFELSTLKMRFERLIVLRDSGHLVHSEIHTQRHRGIQKIVLEFLVDKVEDLLSDMSIVGSGWLGGCPLPGESDLPANMFRETQLGPDVIVVVSTWGLNHRPL